MKTDFYKNAIRRALSLNGVVRADGQRLPLGDTVKKALEAIEAGEQDQAAVKASLDLLQRAHAHDPAAVQSLNALRVDTINNYIYPSMNFGSTFFEVDVLGNADRPVIQNETKQQTSVGYIAEDGSPVRFKLLNPQSETLIPLKLLATDEATYRLQDVYNGDVAASSQKNVDVAFDMANQVDQLAYSLFTAALGSGGVFGAFVTSGTKQDRVYFPNTRILAANLPTTNVITLANNSNSTLLRLAACRAILKYCGQWANAFADGPLFPTGRLIVPSLDAADLAEEIVPTGSTNNAVADGLLNDYANFSYMGVRWTIVPDNTIAPGTMYPQLNKPVGKLYMKPSQDAVFDEANPKKNEGSRWMKKVVGFVIPSQHRPRALKVIYRS